MWTYGFENCNNFPASGKIEFTDFIIKDAGVLVSASWIWAVSTNPCSLSVSADAVSASFSWDTANWTGSYQTCAIEILITIEDEWVENGITQYQFNYTVFDWTATPITSYKFALSSYVNQIWGVENHNFDTYSAPDYVLPFTYDDGFEIGFISDKPVDFIPIQCTGGDLYWAGNRLPGSSLLVLGNPNNNYHQGCTSQITQNIANSWQSNGATYIQVDAVLTNTGIREITSLSLISGARVTSVDTYWSVTQDNSGDFHLPPWSPSLNAGQALQFGYIARSTTLLDFTTTLTCY
eukprot:TRINITY_DN5246_c0_g1_i1.p1 TRINITY_DN5246_c0_g1~~TRINITY_DN5246_c0_g1_i1.p1  ORF type:complete len:293 (+),score=42.69 TRINITY_DN5246_c0_g1_i1:617-1495(+)